MLQWRWLIFLLLYCCQNHAYATGHYTTLYYGHYTDNSLGNIISGKPIQYENSYIAVLAHAMTFSYEEFSNEKYSSKKNIGAIKVIITLRGR